MSNYLYNGFEYPDINEVWTGDFKTDYPYVVIDLNDKDAARLRGFSAPIYFDANSTYNNYVGIYYASDALNQIQWLYRSEGDWNPNGYILTNEKDGYCGAIELRQMIWSNFDILNTDGSVHLAASDPVPVEDETEDETVLALTASDLYKKVNGNLVKHTLYKKVGGELVKVDEYST